jgi:hypothetical protein
MYANKDSKKLLCFGDKIKMLNALGYISTGCDGLWTNGNVSIKIVFNEDKINIIPIK